MKMIVTGISMSTLVLLIGFQPLNASDEGGLQSLRGFPGLVETTEPPKVKRWVDDTSIRRDYVQQPPLIPHKIKGYKIDIKTNKCLTCHSWPKYQEIGATKISLTHFRDRDGNELADVSPRRYFCLQCHVPQMDAQPLVENYFQPVDALKKQ